MSVVINTNTAATVAAGNLSASSTNLQRSLNRLSSGSKIVNPSDDAGGLAVSMKLSAASRRQGAAINNVASAVSFLQTQDGVLKAAAKIMDRVSELATLSLDPTKTSTDTANYDAEYTQLASELTALKDEKFNETALFGSAGATGLTIYTGEEGDKSGTTSKVTLANADLGTVAGSVTGIGSGKLASIKTAIESIATMRAKNGAAQSVLGFASEVLTVNKANLEAASSRITDVDVAQESTNLAKWNVLVQSGTAMLSQANQSAQSALRLLQ